ncbi:MAG: hypothetical protein IPK32_08075 [Verrucomicrobiaceae bacterium]|nr:hypothetical protein [Verrucomicrobiaceae bacterium]
MKTPVPYLKKNSLVILCAALMCQCTSPDLAKHGKPLVKDGMLYYQPVQLETEIARNVKKFLALHKASQMTCVYTGSVTKSKDVSPSQFDPSQQRMGIVRVEKVYQLGGGPFMCSKDEVVGLAASAWVNGQRTDNLTAAGVAGNLYAIQSDGGRVLKRNGETVLLFSGMIELLPTVSFRVSDSFGPFSIKANAISEFDPVSQTRVSCAKFRHSSRAHAGEMVQEALICDEVPGRVLTLTEKTHDLQKIELRLASVTYR